MREFERGDVDLTGVLDRDEGRPQPRTRRPHSSFFALAISLVKCVPGGGHGLLSGRACDGGLSERLTRLIDSIICCRSVPALEKSPVPGFPRLVASTIVLSALFSSVAVHQVHAQNDAPIFSWGGTVQVSKSSLTIREGQSLRYNLRLSKQPASNGWWVRIHVDGVVYTEGRLEEKGIRWVPSVGWKFDREQGKEDSDPTRWRGVSINAIQDDDTENESVTITHEVWDENTNCPPSLHGIARVTVRVLDDDVPGITVSPPRLTVPEGHSRNYTVKLNTQPTATVTVSVSVPSGADVTVDKPTLTFTRDDWSTPQVVRVTAEQDDDAADDEVDTQPPGQRRGLQRCARGFVGGHDHDDDEPGATASKRSLSVPEGGSETYTVELDYQPAATVTVDVTARSGESGPDGEPGPAHVHEVELVRQDGDGESSRGQRRGDGPAGDADARFQRRRPRRCDGAGRDGDHRGERRSGHQSVDEYAGSQGRQPSRTYTVKLDAQPVANVTVAIQDGGDVDVNPSSLTFTPQDWDSQKTVTVEAEHDEDAATDQPVTVTHRASGSSEYTGRRLS